LNWNDNTRQKALVNLGGGPRPQPKTEKGVPVFLHDFFGTGRTAMVVSTRSNEFKAEPGKFRVEAPLTGDESRVAEVKDVSFPQLLDPVDDLPPATVITRVIRDGGKVVVRGTCTDNGTVKQVTVKLRDGQRTATKAVKPDGLGWEAAIVFTPAGALTIEAVAEDAAGNVEKTPAVVKPLAAPQ
jgi:hypothetical protein